MMCESDRRGAVVAPEELAELVYCQLIGDEDDRAVERFTDTFDALVAAERAAGACPGIEASVAAGDGLWVAVPGDGGDAVSNVCWRAGGHSREALPWGAVCDV